MRWASLIAFVTLYSTSLEAQAVGSPPARFDRLRAGRTVRAVTKSGQQMRGTVIGWAVDTLLLRTEPGDVRLHVGDLGILELRRNTAKSAGIGALVGFVPGFAAGVLFLGSICNWGGPDDCGGMDTVLDFAGPGVVAGLPPAAVGALIGAAAGSGWQGVPLAEP